MPRNKAGTPPKYSHLKFPNLAKVHIGRQVIYLGRFDSPESYAKYAQFLKLFQEGLIAADIKSRLQGEMSESLVDTPTWVAPVSPTVGQWARKYRPDHAQEYYASSTGLSRGRVANCRCALRAVEYGHWDVACQPRRAN